jgi:type I restriction enzyme M protein
LNAAVDALDEAGAAELLLAVMRRDVAVILERYVAAQRQQVVMAFEGWWDKYGVNLTQIESSRATAATSLSSFLARLGYV